ncbi:hypothetical protein [Rhizobium sp. SSA_523]|uniref:hypothetical protein n=1 Tax=Rhizobium sp. SSA_523 TaxID=2952477 RepID=UPI002090980F|nr:hypothetical protein [Rhizobium sp. SSA_523]MCO5730280.1 hypothetical protein [Rhizobium sp. SSA_523]WKC25335.1 hypothetical protein QTJ18_15275 [Rhizobium sp. SSA_523]
MRQIAEGSNRLLWCAVILLITALLALAMFGWIIHGPNIYLAMAESLAAWCM